MKRFVASERRATAMYLGALCAILATGLVGIMLRATGAIEFGDINATAVTGLFIGAGLGVIFSIVVLKTEETAE